MDKQHLHQELEELKRLFIEHSKYEEESSRERAENIRQIRTAIFGDKENNVVGMKQEHEEMYRLLIEAQGWKKLGYSILLVAGVIAALKGWLK